jgi:rubrerythrin
MAAPPCATCEAKQRHISALEAILKEKDLQRVCSSEFVTMLLDQGMKDRERLVLMEKELTQLRAKQPTGKQQHPATKQFWWTCSVCDFQHVMEEAPGLTCPGGDICKKCAGKTA